MRLLKTELARESLIRRARSRATGGNIHGVLVLTSYYRHACGMYYSDLSVLWSRDHRLKVRADIRKYESALEYFCATGDWPGAPVTQP